jgi:cob(I)alamin adenosyltransferase
MTPNRREVEHGSTVLPSLGAVSKAHHRVEIDGTVDEVNSLVGAARPTGYDDIDDRLRRLQNQLHVVHATVTHPDPPAGYPQIDRAHVATLERWIDAYGGIHDAMPQRTVPGGTVAGSRLNRARAVCRRAERRAVTLGDGDPSRDCLLQYLNRLGDVLFVFARVVNERSDRPEPLFDPDGE